MKTKPFEFIEMSDGMFSIKHGSKFLVCGIDDEMRWKRESQLTIDDLVAWSDLSSAAKALDEWAEKHKDES